MKSLLGFQVDLTYHKGDDNRKSIKRVELKPVWTWEKSRGKFEGFSGEVSKKIEVAFLKGISKYPIDSERFINFSTFEQARYDDPTKTRRVRRSHIDATNYPSPTWYYYSTTNSQWEIFLESLEIEKSFQYFLKNGKSAEFTTESGDKLTFTPMGLVRESDGVSVEVKRENGPIAALKKTYSQMSEEEKKSLIQAMLNGDIDQSTRPKKKTKSDSSGGNGLFLPKEEEIIAGTKAMKYMLKPYRSFDNSVADLHFRTAESQFYRLLESSKTSYKVTCVEYVVNPKLVNAFQKKKEEFEKLGYPDCSPVFGFHGTSAKNINLICANNFVVPGNAGVKHATDSGWYGKGIYFSEYPEYSIDYIQDCSKLLLCKVILGKSYKCSGLITGQPCQKGYTSHLSPDEKEIVIFHPDQILPCYIVHYSGGNAAQNDTYVKFDACYQNKSYTNILNGVKISLSGTLAKPHASIHEIIGRNGGSHSSSLVAGVTHLVTNQTDFDNMSSKVSNAKGSNIPIVSEHWLYDSITEGILKPILEYSLGAGGAQLTMKKAEIKPVPLLSDDEEKEVLKTAATTPTVTKPMCKYGDKCYRKNAQHFKDFSHPFLIDS
eukprot:gene5972-7439_t